jgi:hypothetical protein
VASWRLGPVVGAELTLTETAGVLDIPLGTVSDELLADVDGSPSEGEARARLAA